jgi:ATP-binding cassette, subfamily F, member 3
MSILTINDLELSYGAFDVFKGLTASIPAGAKIGLIGPNGIGKTSLLLILSGFIQPTAGKVHAARGRRVGYLRQEAVDAFANRSNSVYAEMLSVFHYLQTQQKRLHELESVMASSGYSEQVLEEYGDLQQNFEFGGGYEFETRIQQTLSGLGLIEKYWQMPLNHLSGGQKTRALLARLLLENPDLLMLDEPSNHLDIEAVEWLERRLRDFPGAVLMVSHDRFFLDNTATTIWEMSRTGIDVYTGNYSAYLLQKEERWEYYERVFREEKARLLKEVDFIQRNWVRASTHARAFGLLRRLSRDLAIIDHYGIVELRSGKKWSEMGLTVERPLKVVEAIRKVNEIQMPSGRPPRIRPRFASNKVSGNIVIQSIKASIGYPKHPLFKIENLVLRRGECAALIGPNGSGKTTFLKVLLGQLKTLKGDVRLGAGLNIGYFAQSQDTLKGDQSVLDELLKHTNLLPGAARSHLAQYLFREDDVFKPINALSGGERARIALAILALQGSNFLLLDEPTNHLDIPAREALQEVLENFKGTILLVSHDRYLINRLATQIWDLRDGKLHVYPGNYQSYLLHTPAITGQNGSSRPGAPKVLLSLKPLPRDNSKHTRRREQSLALLEHRIREQETSLRKLTADLQNTNCKRPFEQTHQLSWQVARAQTILDNLIQEWEKLAI